MHLYAMLDGPVHFTGLLGGQESKTEIRSAMKNQQKDRQQPFTRHMALTLQGEEAAITAVALYFLSQYNLGLSFWIWLPLFFSPDIAMLGYLAGNHTGAFLYNLFHHRGLALVLTAIGFCMHLPVWVSIGLLLFAHASFDRMLGFGLKYKDSFGHTHLGWGGK